MPDKFKNANPELSSPASNAAAVTPHDTNELADFSRALWVGGAGNLVVVMVGDSASVTFTAVPAGTLLPFRVKKVLATGTTATSIVAVF